MTPEGLVLSKCKGTLKTLEFMGWVRHWDRLNVGLHMNMQGYMQQHGKAGSPDLIAFVPVDEIIYVMFFEVKRAEGGVQSESQQEFEKKFLGFSNIIYSIITDAKQIKYLIQKVKGIPFNSSKYNDKIEESLNRP